MRNKVQTTSWKKRACHANESVSPDPIIAERVSESGGDRVFYEPLLSLDWDSNKKMLYVITVPVSPSF
jgi:hypothetical protein